MKDIKRIEFEVKRITNTLICSIENYRVFEDFVEYSDFFKGKTTLEGSIYVNDDLGYYFDYKGDLTIIVVEGIENGN